MMNIYNGNVATDANGDAIVPLPEWFETLNRDFRYQLTVIRQFTQAMVTSERREPSIQPKDGQTGGEGLVANDGHSPGCMGQRAPHSFGRTKERPRARSLHSSRTLRRAGRGEHCLGAPS